MKNLRLPLGNPLTLPALTLCATAQAIGAQIPVDPVPIGTYGAIAQGDLDGDMSPEIAVIRTDLDNSLLVFHNPDSTADVVTIASDVLDVCYVPVPDALGRHALLLTTEEGLRVARFDAASATYQVSTPAGHTVEMSEALLARHAFEGGASRIFFHAYIAQERRFYAVSFDGTDFGSQVYLGVGPVHPILDIAPLDYVAGGTLELAIQHANGLQIRAQATPPSTWGPALVGRAGVVSGDAITPIYIEEVGECLAWITRMSASSPQNAKLILFHPSLLGSQGYPMVPLGDFQYGSASRADVDADGREDLVLGLTYAQVHVFLQLGAAPYFLPAPDLTPPMTLEGELPESVEMGKLVCANLFNDRDSAGTALPGYAAMLPLENVLRMRPADGARIEALGGSPQITDYASAELVCNAESDCDDDPLTAPVTAPSWAVDLGGGWGDIPQANAIELTVRSQRYQFPWVQNVAFHHRRIWLPSTPQNDLDGFDVDFGAASIRDECESEDVLDTYYVMVRPIHVEGPLGTGLVDPARHTDLVWRWSVLGVTGASGGVYPQVNTGGVLQMRATPYNLLPEIELCPEPLCGTWFDIPVTDYLACPSSSIVGGRIIPVAVPMSRVPSTAPGVLPMLFSAENY
jgi:hypothetical protein